MIIKILKFCTGSSAKSYQCKFANNSVLTMNRVVSVEEDLGKALQDVIHHKTLRGKFSSVHPELRREGIVRVDVGEKRLHFVRDTGDNEEEDNNEDGAQEDGENEEEELMLRQAIALSLKGAEEQVD